MDTMFMVFAAFMTAMGIFGLMLMFNTSPFILFDKFTDWGSDKMIELSRKSEKKAEEKVQRKEQKEHPVHDGTALAYHILKHYNNILIPLASKVHNSRSHKTPLFYYNDEPVHYGTFVTELEDLMEAFKDDTDNTIYQHIAVKYRTFFSVYAHSIIQLPENPYFFSTDRNQQMKEEQQVLSMSYGYHGMILEAVNKFKQQKRQEALTTIKEAYLYKNEEAQIEETEQPEQPALPEPEAEVEVPQRHINHEFDYVSHQRRRAEQHLEEKEQGISVRAIYNGTTIDLPPGTTPQEAKQALSQIYPELSSPLVESVLQEDQHTLVFEQTSIAPTEKVFMYKGYPIRCPIEMTDAQIRHFISQLP